MGISKETDSIAIVVSEETGKVSLAKDGTLITDLDEENLKKILIKNIVTNRLEDKRAKRSQKLKSIKAGFSKKNSKENK